MASLNGLMDIAKTALFTTQKALNVVSHNIANVNTEGYTRQRVVLETPSPVNFGGLYYGTGVSLKKIERVYDRFLWLNLNNARSELEMYEMKSQVLQDLEGVMNDLEGTGLNEPLTDFFNAFHDLASNPASYSERAMVLSTAEVLVDTFHTIDTRIRNRVSSINSEITQLVKDINSLAEQLADINTQIISLEVSGASNNDLLDKRDLLLKELAEMIDISIVENERGQVDVYVGGRFILLTGGHVSELDVEIDGDNDMLYKVTTGGVNINDEITGGRIKGLIDGRSSFLDTLDKIDLLSATLVKEINLQHRQGYGLDLSTNVDFFTSHTVTTAPKSSNTGGAVISNGTITDLSAITLDDYEIRFSSSTSYVIFNVDTGKVVTTGTYSSGNQIVFDGLGVVITDGTSGPQTGDVFTVSVTKDMAKNISVSISDTDKIAAAATSAGVPGDNENALALADIFDSSVIDGTTFSDYYKTVVADIGTLSSETSKKYDAQKLIVEQLDIEHESISGVSIEEEAIRLIELQSAYEAAAKIISVADEMFETLLSIR